MVRYKNWSEYEFKSSQSPKANFERPSERVNYLFVHSTVPAQMQVVFFLKLQNIKSTDQRLCLYLYFNVSEIKLAIFPNTQLWCSRTPSPRPISSGKGANNVSVIQHCFIQKIKHRTLPNLIFHTHVNLCLKLLKMINCSVSFSTLWPKVICSTTFAVK